MNERLGKKLSLIFIILTLVKNNYNIKNIDIFNIKYNNSRNIIQLYKYKMDKTRL